MGGRTRSWSAGRRCAPASSSTSTSSATGPAGWAPRRSTTAAPSGGPGEVVVDSSIDVGVGDTLRVGQLDLRVVGTSSGIRFNFGTPSLFVALRDAQKVVFDGQPLAMAYAVRGSTSGVAGNDLKVVTNQQAVADLHRTTKSGSDTVNFINILLWIVAAGIVASIVYLNALERTRDFAVLKATGSSNAFDRRRARVPGDAPHAPRRGAGHRGRVRAETRVPVPRHAVGGLGPQDRRRSRSSSGSSRAWSACGAP